MSMENELAFATVNDTLKVYQFEAQRSCERIPLSHMSECSAHLKGYHFEQKRSSERVPILGKMLI